MIFVGCHLVCLWGLLFLFSFLGANRLGGGSFVGDDFL